MAIDRNRGCTIRTHPSGFRVVMYKDAPGEYFAENEEVLTPEIASEAGFDTESLTKAKRKKDRLAKARADIEKEFETAEEEIANELSQKNTKGAYVKHIGAGKYGILDRKGEKLTTEPLTKDQAESLMDMLAAEEKGS